MRDHVVLTMPNIFEWRISHALIRRKYWFLFSVYPFLCTYPDTNPHSVCVTVTARIYASITNVQSRIPVWGNFHLLCCCYHYCLFERDASPQVCSNGTVSTIISLGDALNKKPLPNNNYAFVYSQTASVLF